MPLASTRPEHCAKHLTAPNALTSVKSIILFTVILLTAASVGCERVERSASQWPEPTASAIAGAPREFLGREVKIEGVVGRTFDQCSFEITDDGMGAFDDPMLVLCAATPPANQGGFMPPEVKPGDRLRLEGSVAEMTRKSYERKTAVTLPSNVFDARETRAVFWADNFEVIGETVATK